MICGHSIWTLVRLPIAFLTHFDTTPAVKSNPVWDSYEPAPGDEKPPARADHVLVATGDHIILFVYFPPSSSPRYDTS
jgi:hypothetical protein